MRWLVGDLQGCAREFDRLLAEIRFDATRDELWCLGDLVNRGPDSAAAVRLWLDAGGRGIVGNHDVYALRVREGTLKRKSDTLDDLFAAPDRERLFDALRGLPALVHLPAPATGTQDVWVVHAGIHPRWVDLDQVAARLGPGPHDDAWWCSAEVSFATRARCCTAGGEMCRFGGPPADCPEGFEPWDSFYRGETLVVHGHWARRGYYRGARTIGLDSGCVYGGALTAWCQEEDRVVQVPAMDSRGA